MSALTLVEINHSETGMVGIGLSSSVDHNAANIFSVVRPATTYKVESSLFNSDFQSTHERSDVFPFSCQSEDLGVRTLQLVEYRLCVSRSRHDRGLFGRFSFRQPSFEFTQPIWPQLQL